MSTRRPDIVVEDHGSIAILHGMTDRGYNWIEANISNEGYQPLGLGAHLAELRYVPAIVRGACDDGLVVQAARDSIVRSLTRPR
jgi:hypothetical protein